MKLCVRRDLFGKRRNFFFEHSAASLQACEQALGGSRVQPTSLLLRDDLALLLDQPLTALDLAFGDAAAGAGEVHAGGLAQLDATHSKESHTRASRLMGLNVGTGKH